MSKGRLFSKNILLFSISALIPKILSFLLVPFYTGILTTSEYGLIDIITTTVSLCLPLFTINVAEGVMRFTLDDKGSASYLIFGSKITIVGDLLAIIILLILRKLPFLQKIDLYWHWIPLILLANSFYNLFQFYLRAIDKTGLMVLSSCINSLVMLVSNIVFLTILKSGINGFLGSIFLGLFVAIIVMLLGVDKKNIITRNVALDNSIKKNILRYCIPTVFTLLAWWINSSLDRYFVINMCGEGENGTYSMAYKIPNILGVLQSIFVQAWTLSAIVEFDKDDKDGFFGKTYDTYNGLMLISCSLIMILNIPLSKILYSNDFYEAWKYVPILLVSSLFSALNGYIGSIFSAVKDTKTCAISTIISAIINIVLNALLIPIYGVYGAAIATLISYVCAWLIRFIVSKKYIHMQIHFYRELLGYFLVIIHMILAIKLSHMYIIQLVIILAEMFVMYPCVVPSISSKIKSVLANIRK